MSISVCVSVCDRVEFVCVYLELKIVSLCRCDSPEKLKALLPRLEQELKDSGKFKDFYQFTFNFAKNPGQKGLGKKRNNEEPMLVNEITNAKKMSTGKIYLHVVLKPLCASVTIQ